MPVPNDNDSIVKITDMRRNTRAQVREIFYTNDVGTIFPQFYKFCEWFGCYWTEDEMIYAHG